LFTWLTTLLFKR